MILALIDPMHLVDTDEMHPDWWPAKLWENELVLLQAGNFVVIFYRGIWKSYRAGITNIAIHSHNKQTDHLRKEVETIPNNQMKILDIKTIISEI